MARYSILISLIFALLLVNCAKEAPDLSIPIRGISKYWEHDFDQRRLIELRLAFAKTVARAFVDREFTQYFKNKYCTTTDGHFEELFFGLSRDEIVRPSGTTLYQHLKAAVDPEVFDLFGDTFLDQVLQYDPCVVIKLPDIFASFEWNIDDMRPLVVAQLPFLPNPYEVLGENHRFVGYHLVGRQALMHDRFDYFHVTVKYSEDYAMLDRQSLVNEKGISIYEFLPQASKVANGMRDEILSLGQQHLFHPGYIVVRKFDAFELYRELYGFRGKYWSKEPCSQPYCIRKCIPIEESVLVCDSLTVFNWLTFRLNDNAYIEESYTYSWSFWSTSSDNRFARICLPAVPHVWFDTRTYKVSRVGGAMLFLPKVNVEARETGPRNTMLVKTLIMTEVDPDAVFIVAGHMIIYAQDELVFELAPAPYGIQSRVRASMVYYDGRTPIFGCFGNPQFTSGQQKCQFNF